MTQGRTQRNLRRSAWCVRDYETGSVLSIHRNQAMAEFIVREHDGTTCDEISIVVYDNRVGDNDAMYVPPDLPSSYWEEKDIEEFRIGRSGEAYCCLYTGFVVTETNEVLYFINPPRRGRGDVTYSSPSGYTMYPPGEWRP